MHFSGLADSLGGSKNPLYVLLDGLREKRVPVVDLVKGNVNEHGVVFPSTELSEILRNAADAARVYRPDSFGQEPTRRAIAEYYAPLELSPNQILIMPGTNASYWYCFKLLAEPGDEILTPQPSYPLYDYIARICDVRLTNYRLLEDQN